MDSAKAQLADKLKSSNNVLVTVSRNPSVDQLSALLGLTLALNKTGKHAAAVFSGKVPSTLEFLQPEETIETNTDSLRDFIIALDKSKADKLRYKVEDNVVRIFITPYKTSISEADLEFSQGDFNVDVVVAIGVQEQSDLDEAITAHGRILHDATVTSINTLNGQAEGLGAINWHDDQSSSLSEMVTELLQMIDGKLLDEQIATALMTGIVAETARFSNEKTSAQTMSMSALLMAAGANQQLVASKLDEPPKPQSDDSADTDDGNDLGGGSLQPSDGQPPKPDDGTIEIDHESQPETETPPQDQPAIELPAPDTEGETSQDITEAPLPDLPEPASETESETAAEPASEELTPGSRIITEPPTLGGQLTANSTPEALDPSTDPLSVPSSTSQLLTRSSDGVAPAEAPAPESEGPMPAPEAALTPPPADWQPPQPETTTDQGQTLTDLEGAVQSAATETSGEGPEQGISDARDEVSKALSSDLTQQPLPPIDALNAQPLGEKLHMDESALAPAADQSPAQDAGYTSVEDILKQSELPAPGTTAAPDAAQSPQVNDPTAPPPVPPPIPFQFGQPPADQNGQNPPL